MDIIKKQKQNNYDSQVLEIEKRKINLMEQRFTLPTNNLQDYQDYAFFMRLLPSVKHLNQIEKMKLRMKIMNDVTDALEAHQFVKEVNSSRIESCHHLLIPLCCHLIELKVPSILNLLLCRSSESSVSARVRTFTTGFL